jgi:hypothetical protein
VDTKEAAIEGVTAEATKEAVAETTRTAEEDLEATSQETREVATGGTSVLVRLLPALAEESSRLPSARTLRKAPADLAPLATTPTATRI